MQFNGRDDKKSGLQGARANPGGLSRRTFLVGTSLAAAAVLQPTPRTLGQDERSQEAPVFEISLAEWSLHRMIRGGKLDNLDFPRFTKDTFGIRAVEYVSQFFRDKAKERPYIADLHDRCRSEGVESVLIMIDGEGALGDADESKRKVAIENHYPWVEAAKQLGCHSIRVNAASSGSFEVQQERAADGLRQLSEFAAQHQMNVIVENHGGLSSNGGWLAGVIQRVDMPNCGTLPDFGNFNLGNGESYDRYQGVRELMPFAKAVSAKTHDFDETGNEIHTDFSRMMRIVLDAGYHGFVGIEYEGSQTDEVEGVRLTKALLERVREELR